MTYRARETAGAFGELAAELAAHDELNMTFLLRVERAVVAVSRLDVPTTVVSSDEDGEPARPGEMLIVRFAGRPRYAKRTFRNSEFRKAAATRFV